MRPHGGVGGGGLPHNGATLIGALAGSAAGAVVAVFVVVAVSVRHLLGPLLGALLLFVVVLLLFAGLGSLHTLRGRSLFAGRGPLLGLGRVVLLFFVVLFVHVLFVVIFVLILFLLMLVIAIYLLPLDAGAALLL
jgi:hypothetical protein